MRTAVLGADGSKRGMLVYESLLVSHRLEDLSRHLIIIVLGHGSIISYA